MTIFYTESGENIRVDGFGQPTIDDPKFTFRVGLADINNHNNVVWNKFSWLEYNEMHKIESFVIPKDKFVILKCKEKNTEKIFDYIKLPNIN